MMPLVDHCLNKSSDMTTLTNSLEVFDTYKHRDDKDSDEESFHLPLDDDESESKYQDAVVKNGNGNLSEDEILNKFDSGTPTLEPIDSCLEERLLNEKEDENKSNDLKENGIHENSNDKSKGEKKDIPAEEKGVTENSKTEAINGIIQNLSHGSGDCSEKNNGNPNEEKVVNKEDNVPNVDVDKKNDSDKKNESLSEDIGKSLLDESENILKDETSTKESSEKEPTVEENKSESNKSSLNEKDDKCENSNDSPKSQNDDNEDLFDISIIRDAEEDNAESAYNEAHPEDSHIEENEEDEERAEERMEEECISDRTNNEEEEEDEDHLKNDDVDIEETTLCDASKETGSDGESDSAKKTDLVQINKEQVQNSNSETANSEKDKKTDSRLDEITGNLIEGDSVRSKTKVTRDGALETSMDVEIELGVEKRKSLKRTNSEDGEGGTAKKSKTDPPTINEVEQPKEKLPLRTLLSLSDFMKNRKPNKRLTIQDLEEFCLQKICEVIVHKSDLGDVHHQLKLQDQLIEAMRKEIQQLTKQARDLEIVNKKLMNDLKTQNATQKPLSPLKITRSVGLQVKFTPAYEANTKRRQQNSTLANQKMQSTSTRGGPRNIPNAAGTGLTRQASTPQKTPQQQPQSQQSAQIQQQPKPTTPLLSQALQTRRVNDTNANKNTPSPIRVKVPDVKVPSASVIDLTDEDDKKDKNKTISSKMIQKNIAVPLRTTPTRVNAPQQIRLTTSQGKTVSPVTSIVTSSTTPQVMYVVQSSPQNLTSPLGPKAVVVNFQSANGVISSTLNGSAVSVIPKQSNTIQLKTVGPQKPLSNNKVIKNKHPAPLPAPPMVRVPVDKLLKPIPPKPHLTIRKTDTGIILQWKMPYDLDMYEVIASYQLYAYQETSAQPSTDMWRKVGDVKALALPMACTLTQFADKNKYYFAVRPVDIHKRIGVFSDPEEISL